MEQAYNIHFQEEQRFDQWWMRLLFLVPVFAVAMSFRECVTSETLITGGCYYVF